MAFSQFFVKQFLLVPLDHHWKSFWQQKSSERARPPTASQWGKTILEKFLLIFICTSIFTKYLSNIHITIQVKKIETLFREFNGTHKTQNEYHILQRRIQLIVYRFRKTEFTFKDKFSLLASYQWVMFSYCRHSFSTTIFASIEPEYVKVFQSGFMYNMEKEKPNLERLERIQYISILDFVQT